MTDILNEAEKAVDSQEESIRYKSNADFVYKICINAGVSLPVRFSDERVSGSFEESHSWYEWATLPYTNFFIPVTQEPQGGDVVLLTENSMGIVLYNRGERIICARESGGRAVMVEHYINSSVIGYIRIPENYTPYPYLNTTSKSFDKLFPVELSFYNDVWRKEYALIGAELFASLGRSSIFRMNHIGSTAVSGCIARPCIDILLELTPQADKDRIFPLIISRGFAPLEGCNEDVFVKGYTGSGFFGQAVCLTVRAAGSADEVDFCRYLQENPEIARQYGELKVKLSEYFKNDTNGYRQAKASFVRKYTSLAKGLQ